MPVHERLGLLTSWISFVLLIGGASSCRDGDSTPSIDAGGGGAAGEASRAGAAGLSAEVQAGAGQAGTEQAGAGQAGTEQAGSEQAGSEQAGAGQAGSEQAGAGQAGSEQAGAGQGGIGGEDVSLVCTVESSDAHFAERLGCPEDFEALASAPLSSAIPGARSVKTVIDRVDSNHLYFQNSREYPIHHAFASANLSGGGLPPVPMLAEFNATEYSSPDRRFVLGALTYYEGPDVYAYEVAPYDTADAEMIQLAFELVQAAAWVGDSLVFHPTSDNVAREAGDLSASAPVLTTDDLFLGIDYQPLNLARGVGQLRFRSAADLEASPVGFRDIVVLDEIPNDISVCSGTITQAFQTPLAHINVLAQNRGTPNMALRGAFSDELLRSLEGKWVSLEVGAQGFTIEEVTRDEADAWWEDHRPTTITLPALDLETREIRNLEELLDLDTLSLADALHQAIPAYGGKASHYGALTHIGDAVPYPDGFAVPVYYYRQFMESNGFDERVAELLADPEFQEDPVVRERELEALQEDILAADVDPEFLSDFEATLAEIYPDQRVKVRSSTNCEDLEGFTGAGLYLSKSAELGDPGRAPIDAIRTVWSSVWRYRAFEEREYRGISHDTVGMALLVNRAFSAEDSNGVAITANPFDPQGLEPGFYVNAQAGDNSVVLPDPGVTSEQFVVHYEMDGQPIVYLGHSSLVAEGETVLSRSQVNELGRALSAIQAFFQPVYGPNTPDHFYGMDVEFKFDSTLDGVSRLFIKQARPYPGRGS